MSNAPTNVSDYDAIAKTVQHYIDGAKSGKGADMKPAFHEDATIFGYAGTDLFAGPIQQLFDWNDQNGPATGLRARIVSIDIIETIAKDLAIALKGRGENLREVEKRTMSNISERDRDLSEKFGQNLRFPRKILKLHKRKSCKSFMVCKT